MKLNVDVKISHRHFLRQRREDILGRKENKSMESHLRVSTLGCMESSHWLPELE